LAKVYEWNTLVLRFVCAFPEPTAATVTGMREMAEMSFLEMLVVAELMYESTLTQQAHYHILICNHSAQ